MLRRCATNRFAQLRSFCEFWAYDRPGLTCCQFVDDEVLETDGDYFDCETCAVADAVASLDPDNAEAWHLYGRVCTRFAVDFGMVPDVLRPLVAGWSPDAVADLFDRFAVMYDVLQPPPKAE